METAKEKSKTSLEADKPSAKSVSKKQKCARCKLEKKTSKHHWPLNSLRKVEICDHCYKVLKKQRKRQNRFIGRR